MTKISEPLPCRAPAGCLPPVMAAEDLQRTLTDLGLEQYLPNCLHAGFHNFQSLSSITEAELTALGVRLGHRRKLLRKIARDHYQWPDNRPLPSHSELQEHRNSVRRLARGNLNQEALEENYYSLTSPPQSPSPWSREASTSSASSVSNQEHLDGTRLQLADVLRTNSRLFPIAVSRCQLSTQDVVADCVYRYMRETPTLRSERRSFERCAGWVMLASISPLRIPSPVEYWRRKNRCMMSSLTAPSAV